MKKKTLFLLLTFLWLFNAGVGGYFLYQDFVNQSGAVHTSPAVLSHALYVVAALVAAGLTFWQYRRHHSE